MIKRILPLPIALLAMLPGCHHAPPANIRPPQHIYIPEDYPTPFDARHGDTITLIMTPDSEQAMLSRCNDSGGELIANPYTTIWTCDNIDF